MIDLTELTEELVIILEVSGWTAYGPRDVPSVPSVVVGFPTDIQYDFTASGWTTIELPVMCLAPSASTESAHDKLSEMISGGPGSVVAVLRAASRGVSYRSLQVVNCDGFGRYDTGSASAIACQVNVRVVG